MCPAQERGLTHSTPRAKMQAECQNEELGIWEIDFMDFVGFLVWKGVKQVCSDSFVFVFWTFQASAASEVQLGLCMCKQCVRLARCIAADMRAWWKNALNMVGSRSEVKSEVICGRKGTPQNGRSETQSSSIQKCRNLWTMDVPVRTVTVCWLMFLSWKFLIFWFHLVVWGYIAWTLWPYMSLVRMASFEVMYVGDHIYADTTHGCIEKTGWDKLTRSSRGAS